MWQQRMWDLKLEVFVTQMYSCSWCMWAKKPIFNPLGFVCLSLIHAFILYELKNGVLIQRGSNFITDYIIKGLWRTNYVALRMYWDVLMG